MGIYELAAADIAAIIGDSDTGPGWEITVTDPDGVTADLVGLHQDIGQELDGDGIMVSGRTVTVVLPIAALTAAGLGVPVNVPESTSKPWIVEFEDSKGVSHVYKINRTEPDQGLPVVKCFCEPYEEL